VHLSFRKMSTPTQSLRLVKPDEDVGRVPRLDERSDDDLMLLVGGGHPGAFEVLVRRYQARVLRVAGRRLASAATAREVAQETFFKIFQTATRYQPRGLFSAYLFRVLLRECAMAARSAGAERRRLDRAWELDAGLEPATAVPPEELILRRQRDRDLQEAVTRLSPKLRDAVTLVYFAGLSYQDAAETLRIPMGTLKRRIFDALEKLRCATEGA
jgi:RNA polymerase sigma-70 factor (ECF subfamily)